MLIWTNFDSFTITNLNKSRLLQKFSNRGCTWFFASTKGPGTSFLNADFEEFSDEISSFGIWQKLVKFH